VSVAWPAGGSYAADMGRVIGACAWALAWGCAGAASGLVLGFVQADSGPTGHSLPYGVPVALVLLAGLLLAARRAGGAAGVAGAGVGWLGVTLLASRRTASGDLVVSSGVAAYAYLFIGTAAVGVAVGSALQRRPPRVDNAAHGDSDDG